MRESHIAEYVKPAKPTAGLSVANKGGLGAKSDWTMDMPKIIYRAEDDEEEDDAHGDPPLDEEDDSDLEWETTLIFILKFACSP